MMVSVCVLLFGLVQSTFLSASTLPMKEESSLLPAMIQSNKQANLLEYPDFSETECTQKSCQVKQQFSSLCWVETLKRTRNLETRKITFTKEYSIILESPGNLPLTNIKDICSSNQHEGRSKIVFCGSGFIFYKQTTEWPNINKKRMEIKLNPLRPFIWKFCNQKKIDDGQVSEELSTTSGTTLDTTQTTEESITPTEFSTQFSSDPEKEILPKNFEVPEKSIVPYVEQQESETTAKESNMFTTPIPVSSISNADVNSISEVEFPTELLSDSNTVLGETNSTQYPKEENIVPFVEQQEFKTGAKKLKLPTSPSSDINLTSDSQFPLQISSDSDTVLSEEDPTKYTEFQGKSFDQDVAKEDSKTTAEQPGNSTEPIVFPPILNSDISSISESQVPTLISSDTNTFSGKKIPEKYSEFLTPQESKIPTGKSKILNPPITIYSTLLNSENSLISEPQSPTQLSSDSNTALGKENPIISAESSEKNIPESSTNYFISDNKNLTATRNSNNYQFIYTTPSENSSIPIRSESDIFAPPLPINEIPSKKLLTGESILLKESLQTEPIQIYDESIANINDSKTKPVYEFLTETGAASSMVNMVPTKKELNFQPIQSYTSYNENSYMSASNNPITSVETTEIFPDEKYEFIDTTTQTSALFNVPTVEENNQKRNKCDFSIQRFAKPKINYCDLKGNKIARNPFEQSPLLRKLRNRKASLFRTLFPKNYVPGICNYVKRDKPYIVNIIVTVEMVPKNSRFGKKLVLQEKNDLKFS